MGIVVAVPELHAGLERIKRAIAAREAIGGGGRPAKLSRLEKGIRRARAHMATCCTTGFRLGIDAGGLVWEGRHASGQVGIDPVGVMAFKHDQYRCYGGYLELGDRRCFVLIEADPAKKQDKADRVLLQRVAKAVGALLAEARANPLDGDEEWPLKPEEDHAQE